MKNIKEVPSKAKISSTAHLRPPVELSDCIPRPLGSEFDEPPTKKINKAPKETKKPKAFEKVIKDTSSKKPFFSPIPSHKRFPDDVKYGKEKVGSNVTETLRSKPGQKKDEAFLKPKMHRKKHKSKTKGTIKVTSQVDPKASELLQKESEKFMSYFEPPTTRFTDEEQRGELVCDETSTSGSACPPEKPEEVLPLSGPGFQWYAERGAKVSSNLSRDEERAKTSVITENNEMKALVRGSLSGTISENINTLMEKLSVAGSIKQQEHLSAIISLAKYIIENGLIVPTQDLAKKYKEIKRLKQSSHIESSRLLEILTNHLNVVQIYLKGKGYIIENRGPEVVKLVNSLNKIPTHNQTFINKKVKEAIGGRYDIIMEYLDSKRDRDALNTILTKITSAKFMANLANVQDRRSLQRSKDLTVLNLHLFEQMKNDVEHKNVDETDKLTTEGKRRKKYRLLQKMKMEKLRHIFKGRGRNLKSDEFPDLAGILEFAFGESDRVDRAGGGLESHPRLTDTVLYRAADNNTIMKHARETILALAPEDFSISLSSCFNYTQNYREGTYQAKRHHAGRGINACLSLHKPPRTGVEQFVINLHWSTQNVNLTLDCANLFRENVLVDSKDAKAKVNADVSPVQKPGKTWRKMALPDHDWNRLTHNSVTPMTHLLMETELNYDVNEDESHNVEVRRTGKAVTLLNLSHFEPETVQRVFN